MVSGNKALENLSHCFSVSFLFVWFFNLDMRCKLFSTIVRLIFLCAAMTGGQKLCCIYILDACLLEVSNPIQKKPEYCTRTDEQCCNVTTSNHLEMMKKATERKIHEMRLQKEENKKKRRGGNGSYIWSVSLRGNA